MKISDLLRMCAENLRRRKARSILTIIGVVVGTCSIVVMISFGVAIDLQQEQMMAGMGDLTQIQVYNYGSGNTASTTPALDDAQVAKIAAMKGVVAATPVYQSRYLSATVFAGKNDRYSIGGYNVYGMYPAAMEALGYTLTSGSYIGKTTSNEKEIPVLVGEKAAYGFQDTRKTSNNMVWPDPDVNGVIKPPFFDISKEKLTLRTDALEEGGKQLTYTLKTVGIMKEDMSKGYYTSQGILMDLSTLKKIESEYIKLNKIKVTGQTNGYDNLIVKVEDVEKVAEVEQQIKDLGYETWSMQSMRDSLKQSTKMIQMILGGLGAISMFVAALSITNTMTMAIYERTKEIGVMKVLGCKVGNIRTMFLIEAGMIGALGGIIGLAVSYLISFGLNTLGAALGSGAGLDMAAAKISVIPFWLVLLGLGFSTIVGLVAGLVPANRAVKISALEAIHHE